MNIFDAYATLEANPSQTDEFIKALHRALSRRYHPDKGGGDLEKFNDVQQAYKLIRDRKARSTLAIQLSGLGDECSGCRGKGFRSVNKGWVRVGAETCKVCRGCGYIERK